MPQWSLKFLVPAVGALLALSAALAAACFVKAFGIDLPRPGAQRGGRAARSEVDRSLARRDVRLRRLCVPSPGVFPGLIIDALAPVVTALTGRRPHAGQTTHRLAHGRAGQRQPQLLQRPPGAAVHRDSRPGLAAYAIHRFASHALRRAPAWDCGFPDPSPITQYTAGSFAQPIRRVFGTLVFRAARQVDMPPPGDLRPARLQVRLQDLVWDGIYVAGRGRGRRSPPTGSTTSSS